MSRLGLPSVLRGKAGDRACPLQPHDLQSIGRPLGNPKKTIRYQALQDLNLPAIEVDEEKLPPAKPRIGVRTEPFLAALRFLSSTRRSLTLPGCLSTGRLT